MKKTYGFGALALVVVAMAALVMVTELRPEAQSLIGWKGQDYHQLPTDTLTGISGAENLSYTYNFNGATWDRTRIPNVVKAVSLGAGTTETTIWTPASGKRFRLMSLCLTAGAGTLLTFKDNTGGSTLFTLTVPANTPTCIPPATLGNGLLSGAVDRVLTVTRGTSATLDGFVSGQEN